MIIARSSVLYLFNCYPVIITSCKLLLPLKCLNISPHHINYQSGYPTHYNHQVLWLLVHGRYTGYPKYILTLLCISLTNCVLFQLVNFAETTQDLDTRLLARKIMMSSKRVISPVNNPVPLQESQAPILDRRKPVIIDVQLGGLYFYNYLYQSI